MRTLQTYEDMVEKNWEALSFQGWQRIDAAAKHYFENPGKLDRDLKAAARAARRKHPEDNRTGDQERERNTERLREMAKAKQHIQSLAIQGHSYASIQEHTRRDCEEVTGEASVWSEQTIRLYASVPMGEDAHVDYSQVLTKGMP